MDTKNQKLTFNGGVALIGSLIWDESQIRSNWRSQDLKTEDKILVDLPIRYGRISNTRGDTYTMTFSSECLSKEKCGRGYFVPFREELTYEELRIKAKNLIDAEHSKVVSFTRFNWGWGCIGLLLNPNIGTEKKGVLEAEWKNNYGGGFNPSHYRVGEEKPIILRSGILLADWPKELSKFDFLVATAPKPNIETYPDHHAIAEKMILSKNFEYFSKNREVNIATHQDQEVKNLIDKSLQN